MARAVTVLTRQRKCPVPDVKETAEISRVHTLREEFVSQAQVQGEPAGDLPVILDKAAGVSERWRPQSSIALPLDASVVGKPYRKSAYGSPEPGAFELEVKVEAKTKLPTPPFKTSKRWRRRSAPVFTV